MLRNKRRGPTESSDLFTHFLMRKKVREDEDDESEMMCEELPTSCPLSSSFQPSFKFAQCAASLSSTGIDDSSSDISLSGRSEQDDYNLLLRPVPIVNQITTTAVTNTNNGSFVWPYRYFSNSKGKDGSCHGCWTCQKPLDKTGTLCGACARPCCALSTSSQDSRLCPQNAFRTSNPCLIQCEKCSMVVCRLCTVVDYSQTFEYRLCPNCVAH